MAKKNADAAAYERHAARARDRQDTLRRAAADIAPLPPVADPGRRESCRLSLRAFCETYLAEAFPLAWSQDHLRVFAKLEQAILGGGLFAQAMPRGSGKTTIARAACLWAILYAHRRWACMIGATQPAAESLLKSTKQWLSPPLIQRADGEYDVTLTPSLLLHDFPEAVYPFARLGGSNRRSQGQRFDGRPTHILWGQKEIAFAEIPGAQCGGSRMTSRGLIGGELRGQQAQLSTGEIIRPDLVLLDDPQTRESARSASQNQERLAILNGDVLYLAGPTTDISGLMACTIIHKNDMADQITDRKRSPRWRGERIPCFTSMPTNTQQWDQYRVIRDQDLADGGDGSAATDHYRANRESMDAGAVHYWPARHSAKHASAIEEAMIAYISDPYSFAAEFQNDPQTEASTVTSLDANAIIERLSGYERYEIPLTASKLTAFVDVGDVIFYAVVGWEDCFTGYVLDYGTVPQQPVGFFVKASATQKLKDVAPDGAQVEGRTRCGLEMFADHVLRRQWEKENGERMYIARCMIDANWQASTDVVYRFCRESDFASILTPSHGVGVTASSQPLNHRYQQGDRIGLHWRIPSLGRGRIVRHCIFDTNFWKSFAASRLLTPLGDRGALSLFGRHGARMDHRLIADHCCAEFRIPVDGRGRRVDEWRQYPQRADNDWWDCLVGNAVAASIEGCSLKEIGEPTSSRPKRHITSEWVADRKRK